MLLDFQKQKKAVEVSRFLQQWWFFCGLLVYDTVYSGKWLPTFRSTVLSVLCTHLVNVLFNLALCTIGTQLDRRLNKLNITRETVFGSDCNKSKLGLISRENWNRTKFGECWLPFTSEYSSFRVLPKSINTKTHRVLSVVVYAYT
jgi:hypothetical protein